MNVMRRTTKRGWTLGALVFAVGYALLRLYWATGGRWGYTACDRTRDVAGISTGCGAEDLATLPFWPGWGAVALSGVLAGVAVLAMLRSGRVPAAAAWVSSAVLAMLSFPMHLLFEIPAAAAGRPTDWRDLANRLLLLGAALLFAAAGAAAGRQACVHPRAEGLRPVPAWVRRWAYAGVVVPLLGWTVPHGLWMLGVPFGISADELLRAKQDIGPGLGVAITFVPPLASLLTLGLAQRWGQVFPSWMPWLAGRSVPRLLALVPAGLIALALTTYGVIGLVLMSRDLGTGRVAWSELVSGWAAAGTELVFLGWGVVLGVAATGYYLVTRSRCAVCHPATGTRAS
jgi:hypothetical protein